MVDTGDHIQQGGFSASRLADDGDELSAVDHQVHAFENGELTSGIGESLHDAAHFDDRFRGGVAHMAWSRFVRSPWRFRRKMQSLFVSRFGHCLRLLFELTFDSAFVTNSPSTKVNARVKRLLSPMSCVTMMMVLPRSETR